MGQIIKMKKSTSTTSITTTITTTTTTTTTTHQAARLMELCDAHELPLLLLCDTPGFMVGPEHERQAAVRKPDRYHQTPLCLGYEGYGL